jgi:hypothetical protein
VVEDLLVVGVGDFVVFERRHLCGVEVEFGVGAGIEIGIGFLVSRGTVMSGVFVSPRRPGLTRKE